MTTALSAFIKSRRMRIALSSRLLGRHIRSLRRVGKRVTQEEVSEAIGVSRVWYAMLESGTALHPSIKLVDKLSVVLMLDGPERSTLFTLANPELQTPAMNGISSASLENVFVVSRRAKSRFLSTSSNAEALAVAADSLADWFADGSRIVAYLGYDARAVDEDVIVETRVAMRFGFWPLRTIAGVSTHPQERRCVPGLQPGDGIPRASRKHDLVHVARSDLRAPRDRERANFIRARMRTANGLVLGMYAEHKTVRTYSIEDYVFVASLTDDLGFTCAMCSRVRNTGDSRTDRDIDPTKSTPRVP